MKLISVCVGAGLLNIVLVGCDGRDLVFGSGTGGAGTGGAGTGGASNDASTSGGSGSGGDTPGGAGGSSSGGSNSGGATGGSSAGGALPESGVCPEGKTNCDDAIAGCETDLGSVLSCGATCAEREECKDTNTLDVSCTDGKCALTCAPGFADCDGKGRNGCEVDFSDPSSCGTSCETTKACLASKPICAAGVCLAIPSCDGLPKTCDLYVTENCCNNNLVLGGTFNRGNNTATTATISTFRLDIYEITVARFRRFVDAWVNGYRPRPGDGKHAHLNGGKGLSLVGGGYESGWDPDWESQIGTTLAEWNTNLVCGNLPSWPAGKDYLPATCANWWEMAAFCTWDGGFLPSEAEWEYAATGGSEQRIYPWGNDPPITPAAGTNPTLAAYDCLYDSTNVHLGPCATVDFLARPGVLGYGRGRFYHHDLAGNVAEWTMDYFGKYPAECVDCVNRTFDKATITRGGGFASPVSLLPAATRLAIDTEIRYDGHGARCARRP